MAVVVLYRTRRHRAPVRVSARLLGADGEVTDPCWEGEYCESTWIFRLPDDPAWSAFLFVLDGQTVSTAACPRPPDGEGYFADADLGLPAPWVAVDLPDPPVSVDEGRLQRLWFDQGALDRDWWDLILVGTGIGGGVLLAELTQRLYGPGDGKPTVLALEAGSLLFTGHVANQPRVLFGPSTDEGATPLSNTLRTFGSRPYDIPDDLSDRWFGYEVFALGGRSLYWGGLAPRLSDAELSRWPDAVARDLGRAGSDAGYYGRAEELLGVDRSRTGALQTRCLRLLDTVLPGRSNRTAPIALHRPRRRDWRVSGGLFSTAELLLDQRLGHASSQGEFGPPYIHLAELVTAVEPREGGWLVHGVDLRDSSTTTRRARRVVLCGGTVETPRIVRASGLTGSSPEAGRNLTEHPMAYEWFQVPAGSPFCRIDAAADVLSEPGTGGNDWNLQLQVNADTILDHARPRGYPRPLTQVDEGAVAAQLVFLGRTDLVPDGYLEFHDEPWLRLGPRGKRPPALTLHVASAPAPVAEWQPIADQITAAMGAKPLPGRDTIRLEATLLGAVSHEVGTMRMGAVVDENLRLSGCDGLYVCDNSVFPTSPAANPSLTLAALAIRLADHLWPASAR